MKYFLLIITPVVLIISFYFYKLGYFQPVQLGEESIPSYFLVYTRHNGPYHKIEFAIQKIEDELKAINQDCKLSFGIFYDDPETTQAERLRADIGCAYAQEPSDEIPKAYEVKKIQAIQAYSAQFSGSGAMSVQKVYTEVKSKGWVWQESTPAYEFYSLDNQHNLTTRYYFPR